MLRYKVDVLAKLKKEGYSSTRIRKEKILGMAYLQKIRNGEMVSWMAIDTICGLLHCQPGDLIEYVDEKAEEKKKSGLITIQVISGVTREDYFRKHQNCTEKQKVTQKSSEGF